MTSYYVQLTISFFFLAGDLININKLIWKDGQMINVNNMGSHDSNVYGRRNVQALLL